MKWYDYLLQLMWVSSRLYAVYGQLFADNLGYKRP